MITPWAVGTFNSLAGADSYVPVMQADLAYCNARNMDYMPVIWPGFSWSNWNGGAQNQIPGFMVILCGVNSITLKTRG